MITSAARLYGIFFQHAEAGRSLARIDDLRAGSFDSIAGPLSSVFDFGQSTPQNGSVVLLDDTTGEVTSVK